MSAREGTRLDWWLFHKLAGVRGICVANLHGFLIWRTREDPRVSDVCLRDLGS